MGISWCRCCCTFERVRFDTCVIVYYVVLWWLPLLETTLVICYCYCHYWFCYYLKEKIEEINVDVVLVVVVWVKLIVMFCYWLDHFVHYGSFDVFMIRFMHFTWHDIAILHHYHHHLHYHHLHRHHRCPSFRCCVWHTCTLHSQSMQYCCVNAPSPRLNSQKCPSAWQ